MTAPAANETCPNCARLRVGRYCPGCGQDNRHTRIGWRTICADTVDTLFGIEGRLLATLRLQIVAPGLVARRWLAGQRIRYLPPVRYAVFACGLWWLVMQYVLPPQHQGLARHGNWLNLVVLPILAVPLWVAFLGGRRSFVDHLVVLLFVCGQVFTWRPLLALLGAWQPSWGRWLNAGDSLAFIAYLAVSLVVCHWEYARWLWLRVPLAILGVIYGSSWSVPFVAKLMAG